MLLSGNNSYTGGTTIQGGTLVLADNNALGTGGVLLSSGSLNLNGYANSATGLTLTGGTLAGSGQLGLINAQAGTISANLGGSGGLNKTAGGSVLLSGNNSYTGGTTVGGGVLQLGSTLALPSTGSLTVNSGTLGPQRIQPDGRRAGGRAGTIASRQRPRHADRRFRRRIVSLRRRAGRRRRHARPGEDRRRHV